MGSAGSHRCNHFAAWISSHPVAQRPCEQGRWRAVLAGLIASRITIVEETGSTNADLIAALRAGERLGEGAWHVARRQSAGRGRQGREWFDGSGNFMGSSLVALRPQDPAPASLSFVAGLAVYDTVVEALSGTTVTPSLKWPNDILLGRPSCRVSCWRWCMVM
ncbi:MAG: hypothetical protein AAFY47_04355 [Pseudomonadota bacterium]